MKALILLSHGSRRQESNDEMIQLAKTVAAIEAQPFDRVVCAFQQFAEPSFETAVKRLADTGVEHIVVYPLFLAAGSHVQVDVPRMMDRARADYATIQFSIMPHLGQTTSLAKFLLEQAMRRA